MTRATLLLLLLSAPTLAQDDVEGIAFFESKIRPLFLERCSECHGPDKHKAELRVDDPSTLRLGGDFGPLFVPGDPGASRLMEVISYEDEHNQMPPKAKLPAAQIALLTEWVQRGAPMPDGTGVSVGAGIDLEERMRHWSFQPIANPEVPEVAAPNWPRVSADHFVLAQLEAAGLQPTDETDRAAWMRRVSFDLTGLPPTPDELAVFLADADDGAFARVVDRLLASDAFGEAWGRHWLDLMRYAETKGHEFDHVIPNAWRYRDYVIRAFAEDVPYDELLVEHLAGDLVAEPRRHPSEGYDESVLGTGWWWLGEEVHSPVDIRADETDRIADQVDVISRAFLGLTVACARCHDHKFDAITQRDYYALSGFSISSPYRQVRYETRDHNDAVAARLRANRARHAPAVRAAVADGLEADLADFEDVLRAAVAVIQNPGTPSAAPAAFLDDPSVDLLVEDFEGEDFGTWTAEGDAFVRRPMRLTEMTGGRRSCGAIGAGLISTHSSFQGDELQHTDEFTGTLTSAPLLARRDYLHLLIGGGNRTDMTEVALLVDGEKVNRLVGTNNDRLRAASFDLRDYRGREVQVRIVDQWKQGWGNISVDHLVLSDKEDASALEVRLRPDALYTRQLTAELQAERFGVDPLRVGQAVEWLEAAARAQGDQPLAVLGRVAAGEDADAARQGLLGAEPKQQSLPEGAVVRADWSVDGATPWITDGPLWMRVDRGEALTGPEEARPIVSVEPRAAALADPAWLGLRVIDSDQEPGKLSYDNAGRSLYTPSFDLGVGRLWYLVRGKGRVYAAVDSHKLIAGPLHGRIVQDLDADDGYRWIQQDLSRYSGHRLHLEFSPREQHDFAVVMVVEAGSDPGGSWRPRAGWLEQDADPYAAVVENLRGAAQALRAGNVQPADCATLDWLFTNLWQDATPAAVRTRTAAYREEERELRGQAQFESRTAPALLDGAAADERLLGRGSAQAAGEHVPRAFLTALDGRPIEASGSGRLELARRLTDPANPFVSRVWVNRVWHHLFGRGLAPTVDDFGRMGTGPGVHAALLDHLARRFSATHDWSTKALLRELCLSATYRQGTRLDTTKDAADPKNELLSRMPVKPVTAEALRDAMLLVSGDLDPARFGRPVPIHLTDFLQGRGRPGNGPLDGNRRRSLYLAVRRNFLAPFLMAFDYPVPSNARGARSASNVPAQALTLLNDPFVHQQAERWAGRALEQHGGSSDEALVDALVLRALTRPATEDERAALVGLIAGTRDGARMTAVTDLCHVLFNLKEFRLLR